MKQSKSATRAYKIGYSAAAKMLPRNNPFAPGSSRYADFDAGYAKRIETCKETNQPHPEDYQDLDVGETL
jgi:hypothetical protein